MAKNGVIPENDKKTFINPTGWWSHFGTYTVELIESADKSIISKHPKNIINGNEITFVDGSLGQSTGGISMRDSINRALYWGYHFIVCIRDEKRNLIWVNNNYRNN